MPHQLSTAGPADAQRGFTLVELAVACAVATLLASLALPAYQQQLQQARRSDAVQALTRVQAAQEQYRTLHGLYAAELASLQGVPRERSAQGHYRITLQRTAAEHYRALAVADSGGPQAADRSCSTLVLAVNQGFAEHGPSARCWNR
jgi:type IV pilus assembly protein PilE